MAEVRWTPQAADDLEAICQFIGRDAPQVAAAFADRVLHTTDRLAVFPGFGSIMKAGAWSIDPRFKAAIFEAGRLGMSIHIGTSPHPWAQGIRKELGAGLTHYLEVISVVDAAHYIGHAPTVPKLFQSAWY